MHPAALAGGIGALDVALTGQAVYALHQNDKKDREKTRRRRHVVIAASIYRRPNAPRKRT